GPPRPPPPMRRGRDPAPLPAAFAPSRRAPGAAKPPRECLRGDDIPGFPVTEVQTMADAAPRLKVHVEQLLGTPLPVRIRAWDGSQAGPPSAPTLVVRNRRALRHLRSEEHTSELQSRENLV